MLNENVLIIGYGKSGRAAAKVADDMGAKVSVYDSREGIELNPKWGAYLDGKIPNDKKWDKIIISPGIAEDSPFIQALDFDEIIGELEFAYRIGKGDIVAVTGTNGKTTTVSLLKEIFDEAGEDARLVGNIGTPMVNESINSTEDTKYITEVSSFQLETIDSFRPKFAAILNITPDHLDRHKTMSAYIGAKERIFENQGPDDYLVLNYDDDLVRNMKSQAKSKVVYFSLTEDLKEGVSLKDNNILLRYKGVEIAICKTDDLRVPGRHNLQNVMAAVALAFLSGIDTEIIKRALKKFKGVEHRLEYVDTIKGVDFVNDSKGTNPESTMKAIEAINPKIYLIAGGYEKNADFTDLIEAFTDKVAGLLLMGQTAERIKEKAGDLGFNNSFICKDMDECVIKAFALAGRGDTVLLSPASASWGMYENFEVRGRDFKSCVQKLKEKNGKD